MSRPIEIFCYAAQADQPFVAQLCNHLAVPQKQGIITWWDQSQITGGANREEEIRRHLARAHMLLLLISSDFLADDFSYNTVMRAALERHVREFALAIPVIVRPAHWEQVPLLKQIQPIPRNGLPISGQPDKDHAFWEVTNEIERTIQRLRAPQVEPSSGRPYAAMSPNATSSGPKTRAVPLGQPPVMLYRPIPPQRNRWKKIGVIFVLLAAMIIFVGAAFALSPKGLGNTVSPNTPYPTSTQVSPTHTQAAQNPSPKAPTSLPAASLSSPQLPLAIPCVNCNYPQLTLTLNSIEMDSPARSTRWIFSLTNSGSSSCSSIHFNPLGLTDAVGTPYRGKGQVEYDFAMGAGQSVQEIALFPVLPPSGAQYTLYVELDLDVCNNMRILYHNVYQTQSFTFA